MDNISGLSLLEIAVKVIEERKEPININELIQKVMELANVNDDDKNTIKAKLYVDITTSSKFVYIGDENWDLKINQSLDIFDKDGSQFNPKTASDEAKAFDDEENEDLDENDLDDDDDDDDEDRDEDDEDNEESEDQYDEDEFDSDLDDDLEDEDEDNYDEEKYNKYMDDYEDMYEDN